MIEDPGLTDPRCTDPGFTEHTVDSAPAGSRQAMRATEEHLGYLPSAVARLAASPELLTGFLRLSAAFDAGTLDALAREVVVLTVARRNNCEICLAMHTARLIALGADEELIAALRTGAPLAEQRLEALRVFTIGALDDPATVHNGGAAALLAHGYTHRQALEVVLGIGTYVMSTLANTMTGATVDPPLAAYA